MSFVKFADSQNVFEETIEDFFNVNFIIPFPCNKHKTEVVEYIFTTYILQQPQRKQQKQN